MDKKWRDGEGNLHKGKLIISKDGYEVIECEMCEFKHIIPFIDAVKQEKFYTEEFYQEEKKDYIQGHLGDDEWWAIGYNELYNFFEKSFRYKSRRKILDIGSGPGFFLKVGKARGWDVTGIEPGQPVYEFSKNELNLNIINEFFSRETYQNYGNFDVIHLHNVLEHITNPIDMLIMAEKILLPKGLICVTSPNDFNPLQDIAVEYLGKKHWWVVPNHHVNYFDVKSLKNLFTNQGLNVVYATTSFPLELFLLMGEDYIGNDKIGRKIHAKRMLMEKNFSNAGKNSLKRKIYEKLAEIGIGREITVIGQLKK